MRMEIREPALPDTYGLPIYKVTKIVKQRVGDEIHLLCGTEMFGQTQWLYIASMRLSDVLVEIDEILALAHGASLPLRRAS